MKAFAWVCGHSGVQLLTSESESKTPLLDRFVLMPSSPFRAMWDCFIAIFVIYYCFSVPMLISFPDVGWLMSKTDAGDDTPLSQFSIFLDVFFWCDIVLHFRSAYYDNGKIVTDSFSIAHHYATGWLLPDLIATFPMELFIYDSKQAKKVIKMSKVMKLSKLLRLGRIIKYMGQYFKLRHFVTLSFAFILVSHWFTCVWFGMAWNFDTDYLPYVELEEGSKSLERVYYDHLDDVIQHMMGSAVMETSVRKTSVLQGIVSIIMSLAGSILTAFFHGATVRLLISKLSRNDRFRNKMEMITQEMDGLQLTSLLQQRIRSYYNYMWMNNQTVLFGDVGVYNDPDLSATLKKAVTVEMVNGVFPLRRVPMLSKCSDECLAELIARMKMHVFMMDDVVCAVGDPGREMFFVSKGVLEAIDETSNVLGTMDEGEFFGELALLLDINRTATVRALVTSELSVLSKDDLLEVFAEYPGYEALLYKMAIDRLNNDREEMIDETLKDDMRAALTLGMKRSQAIQSDMAMPNISLAKNQLLTPGGLATEGQKVAQKSLLKSRTQKKKPPGGDDNTEEAKKTNEKPTYMPSSSVDKAEAGVDGEEIPTHQSLGSGPNEMRQMRRDLARVENSVRGLEKEITGLAQLLRESLRVRADVIEPVPSLNRPSLSSPDRAALT